MTDRSQYTSQDNGILCFKFQQLTKLNDKVKWKGTKSGHLYPFHVPVRQTTYTGHLKTGHLLV